MKNKIYKCLVVLLALFSVNTGLAQITISSGSAVTQNFDGMTNSATASLPANWKMSSAGTGTASGWATGTNVTATTQAANSGAPSTGGRYNWGNGTTTTDRAIGFMTSGSYASTNSIMAFYQNTSGSQINDLSIAFDYERYRINTSACSIAFYTSTDGSTWTARTSGDNTFTTGTSAYDFVTGTVASKTVTLAGINIANNGTFYLKWDFNTTGSSSQGVGLDNVVVTPTLATSSAATKFAITSISPASPYATSGFSVTVQAQDNSSVAANVVANTSFTLSTNGNGGTLGGTMTGTITAGTNSGTVSGITLSSAGTGVTLTATRIGGDNLTAATSSTFTVLPPPATQLAFVGVPSAGSTGTNLSSFTVEARRADNTVDVNYTGTITVSKSSGPGTLSGTTSVAAVAGVATFTNLQLNQMGTYTLGAASGSLSSATSVSIVISQSALNHLVISQVYGGGGNSSATYTNDFIEIYNPTGSTVSLSGWSVQYASASGSFTSVTNLSGSIASGKYYLVHEASGGSTGGALPAADATGSINLSGTAGKVALVNSTTQLGASCTGSSVIDLIGYGSTASCSEIAFATAPSNNTTAMFRANNGCTDTDDNSSDFSVATVSPRNSSTTASYCFPTKLAITAISPATPIAGSAFNVTVKSQDPGNNANNVWATTTFTLSTNGNAGAISGTTTGTIIAGTNSVTLTGVVLASEGTGVTITATRSTGDNLTAGTSSAFTVCATPSTFTVTGTGSYCTGSSGVAVGLSGSQLNYSYQLKNGSTNVGSPVTGTGSSISFGNQTAGTYTVLATNPTGGCTANMSGSAVITSLASPTVTIPSSSNISCNGLADGSATASTTGGTGFTYSWSPSGGTAATAGSLAAGTYTCTVTNASGCLSTASVTITEPAALTHSASATNVTCFGQGNGSATVTVGGGTPTYTYSWSPLGGTAATASNLSPGTYTCTITDSNGCTGTETVTVSEPAALSDLITIHNVSCNGLSDGSASVSVSGGTGSIVVSWSPVGSQGFNVNGLAAGNYTCTITDDNGCTLTDPFTVAEPAAFTVSAGNNTSICTGSSAVLTASSNGGSGSVSYLWTPGNMTSTTVTISPVSTTSYTLTGTDNNGCTNNASVTITVNNLPNVGITPGSTSICTGGTTSLTGTGASTYSWMPGSQSGTTLNVSPSTTTIYTVTGTDANGCVNTAQQMITVNTCVAPTKIRTTYCGTTVATMNTPVYVDAVVNATNYEYEFTDISTGTVVVKQRNNSNTFFQFSLYSELGFNKTYSIRVRAYVGGTWGTFGTVCNVSTPVVIPTTQITASQCGQTASSMNTTIYADPLSNASIYEFEFTDISTGVVVTKQRNYPNNFFQFSLYSEFGYGKTYSIRVRANVAGTWNSFGTSCNVSTPGFPTTKIVASQCGLTVSSMTTTVYADAVTNAGIYEFEFTDISTGTVVTKQRNYPNNFFQFSLYTEFGYGKTYSIRVRANVAGTWGTFGTACNVSTPALPTTKIVASQCGQTASSMTATIYADAVSNASIYEFEFTDISTGMIVTKQRNYPNNFFQFSGYPDLAVTNKTYSIRVRANVAGTWGTFGTSCNVSTPSSARMVYDETSSSPSVTEQEVTMEKDVIADAAALSFTVYPNPNTGVFNLEFSPAAGMEVELYDGLGRTVIKEKLSGSLQSFSMDEQENGIYYLRVTQGNKTLYSTRLVKQD